RGLDGPCPAPEGAVVEARHAADRVEEQPAAHLHQLGIADVPAAGQVVRAHLGERLERPPAVTRLEDLDARPCRTDLTLFAAPEDQQDAATETEHRRVLAVQPVRVDDALVGGEGGRSSAAVARASPQGYHQYHQRHTHS